MSTNQFVWAFAFGATSMGLLGTLFPAALVAATFITAVVIFATLAISRWSRR